MTHTMQPPAFDGTLSDLEAKADIPSLQGLHAERRQLLPEYAALRALHGPGNKWDNKRKALLSVIKVRVRMSKPEEYGLAKWTDDSVDAVAHADEQYVRFIDEGIEQTARYVDLDTQLSEIAERIEARNSALYAWSAEARLQP
jgi:hypothetical protein